MRLRFLKLTVWKYANNVSTTINFCILHTLSQVLLVQSNFNNFNKLLQSCYNKIALIIVYLVHR